MWKTLQWLVALALSALLLSGCAAQSAKPNSVSVRTAGNSGTSVETVVTDPNNWIGIRQTDAVKAGRFLAVETVFPYDLKEELQEPRIRWHGYATDDAGVMYPIQVVFTGCSKAFGKIRMLAVIEGATASTKGLRGIHLSTLLTEAYGLDGKRLAGFEDEQFRNDVAYRRGFIRANGTPIGGLPQVDNGRVWNMLDTFWQYGDTLYPPSTSRETVLAIIGMNPAVRSEQKYQRSAVMGINPFSFTGTAFMTLIDGGRTLFTPCYGWNRGCRVTDAYYHEVTGACMARQSAKGD